MHNIFETLEQTEMWYGQDDYPYRIEEMDQSHRINTYNFLKRRAYHLHARAVWAEMRHLEGAPEEVINSWMHENKFKLASKPEDWLVNTPFMKALEQAIKNHGTIDGEVVSEVTLADALQSVRDGQYRMKRSATGRLVLCSDPPLQGISPPSAEELAPPFECFIGHDDCDSEENCTENRYQDWKNSHDTTECGGMQNGCQLCAHIW